MKYQLVIAFLFFSLFLQAQHPYAWNLGVEDGLPSLEVYDLYEDSKGYMWIGTDKGLCKYNGSDFSYYHNKEELGEALAGIQEDLEGRIWVRNFKDQIFYVEDDSLHQFEIPKQIHIRDFLVDTKGAIWLIGRTTDSLYCYDGSGRWKSWGVTPIDTIGRSWKGLFSIIEGKNHTIYFTSYSGLFKCVGDSVSFITGAPNLESFRGLVPAYLFKDKDSSLFLLQTKKGYISQISQLLGNQVFIIENASQEAFFKTHNHALRVDRDNLLWQLTLDGGLGPILNTGAPNKLDSTLLLFPNEGISDLVVDREGNYWISSLSKGVYIIPNLDMQQYTATNSCLRYDQVGLLEKRDKETLFIETGKGSVYSYNTKEDSITDEFKISEGKCIYLSWQKNKLLVNGNIYQEIHVPSTKPTKQFEFSLLGSILRSTFIYKDKYLVNTASTISVIYKLSKKIGTERVDEGLFSYLPLNAFKGDGFYIYNKIISNIPGFHGIADEEKGRILIARDDSLVCYPEEGLPFAILDAEQKTIRGVYMERDSKGVIWVCTVNSGIYALNKEFKVVQHFTVKDGLINNKIKKLKTEGEHLWLLYSQGIQRFTPKTKESRIYTTQDGLPTHEIRDLAIVNHKVWLSTAKGLVSFDQNMPSKNKVPPYVYIKNISIHDKDTLLRQAYDLTYEQDNITISVEGLAYRSRGTFQYKYRMLGIDTTWRYQDAQTNFMRFPQLQSGEYTFEVKAVNEDGVESAKAAKVVFFVGLPYWKTWWFILIIVFLILLGILAVVRNQLRQARLENQNSNLKMEALQSQMNPHFIFNVLTAVQNLWLQHKNELAMDLQSNFAKLLRKIFQYSSKRAISIEQVEEFLNNYLSLEQIRFENAVEIDFQIEEELLEEEYRIPPLLIQPVIENSFKHGLFHKTTNRKLSIHLKQEGAYLYCCVIDNGVGRKDKKDKPKLKRSSGLSTTQERLVILQENTIKAKHPHNNFKITDLKNPDGTAAGTKVELWIPFI